MNKSEMSKLFPDGIKPGMICPFVHKGKWAIHELLPTLLEYTGKADVYIATFNISEDSLRPLFFLLEEKKLNSLTLLLDTTVKRHKLELLMFAANITPDVHVTSNHMKVLLVENGSKCVGLVGSANMNNNPRYEAGFVFTEKSHYDYFKTAYMNAYNNDSFPFEWT